MVTEAPQQTNINDVFTKEELEKIFGDAADIKNVEIGQDSTTVQAKLGVLQRIITAIKDDLDYRQALYQGYFENKEQAALAADAISERKRYGVPITPIVDRVISACGVKGMRVDTAVSGMNRFSLNTHSSGVPGWKKRQEDKSLA